LNYGKDFKVEKRGPFLAKGSMRAKLKTWAWMMEMKKRPGWLELLSSRNDSTD
jgi:hypothetical protein